MGMRMIARTGIATCVLLGFLVCPTQAAEHTEENKEMAPGMTLPDFKLPVPGSSKEKRYLGLHMAPPGLDYFSLSQLPSRLVLIEIFGTFCAACNKNAPTFNKIYKVIKNDSDLRKDIKVIGLGGGNTEKHIRVFKSKYRVPFPLFPDPDFAIFNRLGAPHTPFSILAGKKGVVLYTHPGPVTDMDEFLKEIRKHHSEL